MYKVVVSGGGGTCRGRPVDGDQRAQQAILQLGGHDAFRVITTSAFGGRGNFETDFKEGSHGLSVENHIITNTWGGELGW